MSSRRTAVLRSVCALACGASPALAELSSAPYAPPRIAGKLGDPRIVEASGLCASHHDGGVLWVLNDGGRKPDLFAVATNGVARGDITVSHARFRDREDLALVPDGRHLLIADVGDNAGKRAACTLAVIVEPHAATGSVATTAGVTRFRYPDGPRDCESVAVDGRRVLLLSKRDRPPVLYALPFLPAGTNGILTATRLGALTRFGDERPGSIRPGPKHGRYATQPTAMDLAPGGRVLAVLTYGDAYVWTRVEGEPWLHALDRPPRRIALPARRMDESLCFGLRDRAIWITYEGRHAPIVRCRPGGPRP